MIRAFVGLAIPESLGPALLAAQAGLPVGRAVPPEALHLTLAFLGTRQAPVLEDLHYALEEIDAPPVSLRLEGLGTFGGDRPHTLYAAVAPDAELTLLRKRVAQAARSVGIDMPRERFVPHITLARLPRDLCREDYERLHRALATRVALKAGPAAVPAFTLFRSHLGSEGASYEVLADYPLG